MNCSYGNQRSLPLPDLVRRVRHSCLFKHARDQRQAEVQALLAREPRKLLPDPMARVPPRHQHRASWSAQPVDVVVSQQPGFLLHERVHERRQRLRLGAERLGEADVVEAQVVSKDENQVRGRGSRGAMRRLEEEGQQRQQRPHLQPFPTDSAWVAEQSASLHALLLRQL